MDASDMLPQGVPFPMGFQPGSRRPSFQGTSGLSPESRVAGPNSPSPDELSLPVPPSSSGHRRHPSGESLTPDRSRASSMSSGVPSGGPTFIFNSCHVTYQQAGGSNPSKVITGFLEGQPYYIAPGIPSPPLSSVIDNDMNSPESVLHGLHGFSHLSEVQSSPTGLGSSKSSPKPTTSYSADSPPQRGRHSTSPIHPSHSARMPVSTPPCPANMQRSRSGSAKNNLSPLPGKAYSHQRSPSQSSINSNASVHSSPQQRNSHQGDNRGASPSRSPSVAKGQSSSLLFPELYTSKHHRRVHEQAIYQAIATKGANSPKASSPAPPIQKLGEDNSLNHDWRIQSWEEGPCKFCTYPHSYMKCRGCCDSYMCVMCYVVRYPEATAFQASPSVPSQCISQC
ncbi:hypothetical protein BKA70DRAFT_853506 [Coprinopsis sp. MPI-PUGE-AT-0042]|nr:hypothetical protein BKA70DRAFT_853506 [Coprinopsis sp. MPI-PUGE-AT-0042]